MCDGLVGSMEGETKEAERASLLNSLLGPLSPPPSSAPPFSRLMSMIVHFLAYRKQKFLFERTFGSSCNQTMHI